MIEFYHRRQPSKLDIAALSETISWLRNLNQASFEQWCQDCQDCLEDLAKLPQEQQSEIRRMFDFYIRWQWDNIEKEVRQPYAWAAFILSGGFF